MHEKSYLLDLYKQVASVCYSLGKYLKLHQIFFSSYVQVFNRALTGTRLVCLALDKLLLIET
jgi:hypothetical protein